MYETPLLTEPGIHVTTARFVVGHQTYPIASITSVSPFTIRASRTNGYLGGGLFVLLTLLTLVPGLVALNFGGIVIGLIFGGLATLCISLAKAKQDTHGVVIATSGMQVRALVTNRFDQVSRVVMALNQAIASR